MGIFSEGELDSLKDLAKSPGASTSIGDDEVEQIEDVYWDDPDTLDQNEKSAIGNAVKGFKQSTGPGIDRDFEDDLPKLLHESRGERAQGVDESLNAPKADSWQEYVDEPNRFDWPGIDKP